MLSYIGWDEATIPDLLEVFYQFIAKRERSTIRTHIREGFVMIKSLFLLMQDTS